jgi:putative MATE family efflux protein
MSLLAQNIIIVVDTAFLGRIGEIELGASAIGGLFYVCLYIIGFGFGTGQQILIGRRNGEKQFSKTGRIFDHGLYFLLGLGVILFFTTKVFSATALNSILSSPEIYNAAMEYLDIRIWGILLAFININFRTFYIGITKTKFLTYSAAIMAFVNIGLDYLLIFGNYGFPEMGIAGAALASVIAEGASVIFFIVFTFIKMDKVKYQLFRFHKFEFRIIRDILNIAGFMSMQYFISVAGWFSFFLIIEQTGERPLAISNIIRSLYMILTIPIWGLGSATNTIISNIMGEGKINAVIPAIIRISKISLLSMLAVIALSFAFTEKVISLYTNDPSLIEATLGTYYIVLSVFIIFSLSIVVFNGVAGTANTKTSLTIEVISVGFYLILAYIFAIVLKTSIEIIWCSEYLYFSLLGLLSVWYLAKGKWRDKKI